MPRFPMTTLDGQTAILENGELDDFAAGLRGQLLGPRSPGYHEARALWNSMIDRQPGLIVECAGTADVIRSVMFARRNNLLTSVRGSGHNVAGYGSCDGGLMISLSEMNAIRVDPRARTAWVGPGALLHEFDLEAQAFGLATPLGINSTTGVGGLALGGGFGWLSRKYGLTADNLMGADVVTADGAFLRATEDENADLLWGLRGGGGNFGVVTSFEFKLHPFPEEVLSGLIVHPLEDAKAVLQYYRDFALRAPDELTVWVILRKAPPLTFLPPEVPGKPVVILACLYAGDVRRGEEALKPLRMFGRPIADVVRPRRYLDFQKAFDPFLMKGKRNYWKSHDFQDLPDDLIDAVLPFVSRLPTQGSEVFIAQMGGASGRVPADATAYHRRATQFILNLHGRWHDEADDGRCVGWTREVFEAITPYATGSVYVNFLSGDEGDRVPAAYGGALEKMVALKAKYDPSNFFRVNQNVRPPG